MKSKNIIQIVETPIIDNYDFHENNGIINPAFLETHTEESDTSSSRALVESDYRQCFHPKNGQSVVHQYPSDDLIIEHRPNGTSVASSWVYEFNNGSPRAQNMTSSPNSLGGMYRSPYSMGYNEHLSYDMDLNRDHRLNTKERNGWWSACIKLFVWTVIVLCLIGVFLSIAFIIYIEKYAPEDCCQDTNSNSTGSHELRINGTTVGLEINSERVTDSTPALVDITPALTVLNTNISEMESKASPTVTTTAFFGTNSDNSSSDLSTTENSLVINGQNSSQELNVTELPQKSPETTEIVSTTSSPTTKRLKPSSTRYRFSTTTPSVTTYSSEKPINKTEKTTKSSFESRVLTTNSSETPEVGINSVRNLSSDQIIGNKSIEYSSTTTSSPETTTRNISIETTTEDDIVAKIVGEIEKSPTLSTMSSDMTTSATESNTPSSVSGYSQANYNHTEQAINLNSVNIKNESTTIATTQTIASSEGTTLTENTTTPKTKNTKSNTTSIATNPANKEYED